MQFSFFLIEREPKLIYFKIAYGSQVLFYFLFYLHTSQIKWAKTPRFISTIGWGWAIFVLSLISLWSKMIFDETEKVLFFIMPNSYTTFFPDGAGVRISGYLILGTSYRLVSDLYRLFVISFLLYTYTRVTPVSNTPRIRLAKRLWITAATLHLFYLLTTLPWGILAPWPGVFVFVSSILILFITIYIPEATLISREQLLRAKQLYNKLAYNDSSKSSNKTKIGRDSIASYLDNLPQDIREILQLENSS